MASSREFSSFFFVSLFTCFDHFIRVLHYLVGRSIDCNEELFLTQNYFSQEV